MSKNYIDYCREAVRKYPDTYSSSFNQDGTLRSPPKMQNFYKKELNEIPKEELAKMKKIKVKENIPDTPKISMTEIRKKVKKANLEIWEIPRSASRKEYNKIWMHNYRVRQRIKKLKELYGVAKQI